MELVPYGLLDLYAVIYSYLESCRISSDSQLAKVSESILGEKGKDLSGVDALLFTMTTAGTIIASTAPQIGIPLAILGFVPMTHHGCGLPSHGCLSSH